MKAAIIERTMQASKVLPDDKAAEVADFAEFMMKKYED